MIKLDSVTDISDIKEMPEQYRSIKPAESTPDQEIAAFISNEFENARNIAEFDTYDRLLSDVFNRFEDEIDIDFSMSENTLALLENFRPDKWETMNDSEKKSQIEILAKAIGEELGIKDIPSVNISEGDDSYGFYDPQRNSITLNSLFLSDPIELVNTIAHEMRHAYQHMRADILETREDALYKVNYENYITPLPLPEGGWLFFTDYYNQYVEVDARAFADKFTEAMI